MVLTSPVSHGQTVDTQLKKIQYFQSRASYDSARLLANSVLSRGKLSTEEELRVLISKQFSFYYLGRYDSLRAGLSVLEKEIAEKDVLYADLLIVRGMQKGEDALFAEAISDLLEAEKRFLVAKDQEVLGMIYNSLAGNFKKLVELGTAKVYYEKARVAFENQGNSLSVAMVYNNLGGVYRSLSLLDSALYVYGEASKVLVSLNNSFLLAQNTLNMGNVYEHKGDLTQAEASFLRCLSLSESNNLQYGVLLSTLNLGNLYRLKKDYTRSEVWLKRALEQSISMGLIREKGLALERLSWLARDTNNYEEAYLQSVKAAAIQDSLASESVKKEVVALQEKFENEKTQNEILSLAAQNQQVKLGVLAAGIGILLLFAAVLYFLYRQKQLYTEKLLADAAEEVLKRASLDKDSEVTAQARQLLDIKKLLDEQTAAGVPEEAKEISIKRSAFEFLQNELENRINEANGDFFKNLLLAYPDLKPTELKLCFYLRLDLSTMELAALFNKSKRTIENIRFSIRKKLGIGAEESLVAKLEAIGKA